MSSNDDGSSSVAADTVPKSPDSSAVADAVSPVSPTAQMTAALLTLNLNMSNPGAREAVETGLRAWNSIPNVCQPMVDAIAAAINAINAHLDSIKLHFNPEIGLLSDFVQHCKLIISVNRLKPDAAAASEAILAGVTTKFEEFILTVHNEAFRLTVDRAAFILGTQISLVLRIGEVFNVPVFTAYGVCDVFNNEALDSDETVGVEFMYRKRAHCPRHKCPDCFTIQRGSSSSAKCSHSNRVQQVHCIDDSGSERDGDTHDRKIRAHCNHPESQCQNG